MKPKGARRESKGSQNEPRIVKKHYLQNRIEKLGLPIYCLEHFKHDKSIQKVTKQISHQKTLTCKPKGGTNMEPTSMPQLITINAKTCNEKDHDNHHKSCVSDV